MAAALLVAAAASVIGGDHAFEHVNLFLILSGDGNGVVLSSEELFLVLLPQKALLHLVLLFLPHLHQHLLHPHVHLLPVLLPGQALPVHPGVLQQVLEGYPLFGVGVQHALDEV